MFTGIVKDIGEILSREKVDSGVVFAIKSKMDTAHFIIGNSIAVDGVCLTVDSSNENVFKVIAVPETLGMTSLGIKDVGDRVNLEPPATLQTPLAGHLVSGHIDATAEVLNGGTEFLITIPKDLVKYTPKKGSITLNGVSLTIADRDHQKIRVALIPETLKSTNLGDLKAGDKVNVEIDLFARYIEQMNSNK